MNELAVAVQAAQAAARVQRRALSDGIGAVRHKGSVDLVTATDLASERAIREVLERHLPEVPILGEEEGGAEGATTRWVVDPLDGTTNFVHGLPHFGPSVALEVDGEPVLGVVIDTMRGEIYRAAKGQGAFCGERPLAVSTVDRLDHALVATGFPYDRRTRAAEVLAPVQRVLERCQGLRRAGAAALDLAWVAAGRLDAYWERDLGRWDVAAGVVLVREAGGRVEWLDGTMGDRPSPLATNGRLHEAFAALVS
jgi:myo-inositol-1(or 4)-monophosphatase